MANISSRIQDWWNRWWYFILLCALLPWQDNLAVLLIRYGKNIVIQGSCGYVSFSWRMICFESLGLEGKWNQGDWLSYRLRQIKPRERTVESEISSYKFANLCVFCWLSTFLSWLLLKCGLFVCLFLDSEWNCQCFHDIYKTCCAVCWSRRR